MTASLVAANDLRFAQAEADHDEHLIDLRADLLTHLSAGLTELARAAAVLEELRAPAVYDVELAEGRDGRDAAARLDGTIRDARATYAVLQMVFAGETPR